MKHRPRHPKELATLSYPQRLLLIPITLYRLLISPVLPCGCRYLPSCSEYAAEAIIEHGAIRGCGLMLKRLCRCQPWGGEGYDPVPPRKGNGVC